MGAFLKTLGAELYSRVILSYKSTLIGVAAAAGIVAINQFTALLQGLPSGFAQIAAGLAVTLGALAKSKLQAFIDAASKPAP